MAVSYDNGATNLSAGTSALSIGPFTVTGTGLMISCQWSNAGASSSAPTGALTWTQRASDFTNTSGKSIAVWSAPYTPGTYTITQNWASSTYCSGMVFGVAGGGGFDAAGIQGPGVNGSAEASGLPITTMSSTNDLVYFFMATGGGTGTVTGVWNPILSGVASSFACGGYQIGPATTYTPTASDGAGGLYYLMITDAVTQASVGPTSNPTLGRIGV